MNNFMAHRQRQFSRERSRASSRAHSQMGYSTNKSLEFSFLHSLKSFQDSCVNCINKNLAQSKLLSQQQKQKQEIDWHLQTINKINSTKDFQKQIRQKKILQTTQFNKRMSSSKKKNFKNIKFHERIQAIKLIKNQEQYLSQKQQNQRKFRIQLHQKYQHQLKKQLKQQTEKIIIKSLSLKFEEPSEVNRLKVIQENQRYIIKKNLLQKNCRKLNKELIFEKSLYKNEQKQRNLNQDKKHLETVESQFKSFTQFQPLQSSPYRFSRSSFIQQENPQNYSNNLKRIQTQKILSKMTQREQKNKERALELKTLDEANRKIIRNKINSMKNYLQELKIQLLDKRRRALEEQNYRKNFEPQKTRVYCFTEELKNEVSKCESCDKFLEKKYFGI